MASPFILSGTTGPSRYFWNIDSDVGRGAPNLDDDVQLVQLAYFFMAQNRQLPLADDVRAAFARVKPGTACTGREDDPLVAAIRAHQKGRAGTQDGKVSVIKSAAGTYHDPSGTRVWILIALVNNIMDAMPAFFPRVDQHEACPPALKARSRAAGFNAPPP